MPTQTITTATRSFRIYLPSNWESLTSIPIDGKPLRDRKNSLMMLKYLIHGCRSAQFFRDDKKFPLSYFKAQVMCHGDRNTFSKLRKTLLTEKVIECDGLSEYGKKAFYYSLGSAMDEATWRLSAHKEPFKLPVYHTETEVSKIDLTVDSTFLGAALEATAKKRNWEPDRIKFWDWYLTDGWNNDVL